MEWSHPPITATRHPTCLSNPRPTLRGGWPVPLRCLATHGPPPPHDCSAGFRSIVVIFGLSEASLGRQALQPFSWARGSNSSSAPDIKQHFKRTLALAPRDYHGDPARARAMLSIRRQHLCMSGAPNWPATCSDRALVGTMRSSCAIHCVSDARACLRNSMRQTRPYQEGTQVLPPEQSLCPRSKIFVPGTKFLPPEQNFCSTIDFIVV